MSVEKNLLEPAGKIIPVFEREEDDLRWQLSELLNAYRRDAKPLIDRLIQIESIKTPAPLFFDFSMPPAFERTCHE